MSFSHRSFEQIITSGYNRVLSEFKQAQARDASLREKIIHEWKNLPPLLHPKECQEALDVQLVHVADVDFVRAVQAILENSCGEKRFRAALATESNGGKCYIDLRIQTFR